MARKSSYTYDPSSGKWSMSQKESPKKESPKSDNEPKGSEGNLKSTTSDKNSGKGKVEKKQNTIEINTLEGSLSYIASEQTIKLRAGDTVKLLGLGKYLSGKYYVKDVTRTIDSNGYSHSATVIKTDFGTTLKVKETKKVSKELVQIEEKKVSSPISSKTKTPVRTHTVKKGECCLWGIAKKYYGNGSLYTKIYDANTNEAVKPDSTYIGQVLVIP